MTDQIVALRAVIDAARRWREKRGESASAELEDAVNHLEEVLKIEGEKQATGFVTESTWGEALAGWFVRTPNLEWWEIYATAELDGKQEVTIVSPAGKKVGPLPRDPAGKIMVRKHSKTAPTNAAMEALSAAFPGTTVVEDPPWDRVSDLAKGFREVAHDTIIEWCRRWPLENGDQIKVTYDTDGTAEIERETDTGFDREKVRFEVRVMEP